jgi:hypothetical protein
MIEKKRMYFNKGKSALLGGSVGGNNKEVKKSDSRLVRVKYYQILVRHQ